MALSKQINITVAANTASAQKEVDQLRRRVADLEKQFESAGKNDDPFNLFKGLGRSIVVANQLLGIASKVTAVLGELSERGAKMAGVSAAFEKTGVSIEALRHHTAGAISDFDLMSRYNNALRMGLVKTEAEFGNYESAVSTLAAAVGEDGAEALDRLTSSLGRGRTLMLERLGVYMESSEAESEYASKIGKTVEALTDQERQQAVTVIGLERLHEAANSTGRSIGTMSHHLDRSASSWENAKNAMGEFFSDSVKSFGEHREEWRKSQELQRQWIAEGADPRLNTLGDAEMVVQDRIKLQQIYAKATEEHLKEQADLQRREREELAAHQKEILAAAREAHRSILGDKVDHINDLVKLDQEYWKEMARIQREGERERDRERKEASARAKASRAEQERIAKEKLDHELHVMRSQNKAYEEMRGIKEDAATFDEEHHMLLAESRSLYIDQLEELYERELEVESRFKGDPKEKLEELFNISQERNLLLSQMAEEEIRISKHIDAEKERAHKADAARKRQEADMRRTRLAAERQDAAQRIMIANHMMQVMGSISDGMVGAFFQMFEANRKSMARMVADFAKAQAQQLTALGVRYMLEAAVHAAALNPAKAIASKIAGGIAFGGAATMGAMFAVAKHADGGSASQGRFSTMDPRRTESYSAPETWNPTSPYAGQFPQGGGNGDPTVVVNASVIGATEDQVAIALERLMKRGKQQTG